MQPKGVTVILSPFDAGRRDWRMGAGPNRVVAAGIIEQLERRGLDVVTAPVELRVDDVPSELRRGFAVQRAVAARTTLAMEQRRFPVLLAGDCNSSLGVVAGLQAHGADPAFVWCDAHADFHTPDTDPFGSLDSHGLSMLTGRSWHALVEQTGLQPLQDSRVALVGARAVDPPEEQALWTAHITRLSVQQVRRADARTQELIPLAAGGATGTHFHIDADALDPDRVGPANDYAAAEGLLPEDLIALATKTPSLPPLAALSVISFDPRLDVESAVATALVRIVTEVVQAVLD